MAGGDDYFDAVLGEEEDYAEAIDRLAQEQRNNRITAMVRAELERREALEQAQREQSERDLSARGPLTDRILDYPALRALPLPQPLVKDVLYTGSVAVVLGDSQTGKTWVMLSIAAAAASGMHWPTRPDAHAPAVELPVLYVAAEDGGSIGARLGCWERAYGRDLADAPLHTHASPINILDPVEIEELARVVTERGYRIVIIDTVAATFGGEEEGNAEFSRIVRHCRQVAAAMAAHGGGSVVLVHHFGKDKSKGGRGGSSLFNDSDIVWELSGTIDAITMTCKKWKSDSIRQPIKLRLDRQDPNAVHLVLSDHAGGSATAEDPREKYSALHHTVKEVVKKYGHENQGYGLSQNAMLNKLREMGCTLNDHALKGLLESMVMDREIEIHEGPRRAKLYRPAPVQESLL